LHAGTCPLVARSSRIKPSCSNANGAGLASS
jgi:hypothetical protein